MLHFFHNLQTGPISQNVTLHLTGKPYQRQTLYLKGPLLSYKENEYCC
jgi:hypothetical protein